MPEPAPTDPALRGPPYEIRDVPARWPLGVGLGTLVLLLLFGLGLGGMTGLFARWSPAPGPAGLADMQAIPPGPRLEQQPERHRIALEQAQQSLLRSYGWVDRAQGLAHIPIDRAMQLLAQRGWPEPAP